MPAIRRDRPRRRELHPDKLRQLLRGGAAHPGTSYGLPWKPSFNWEALRSDWQDLRAELLPAFIAEHPGSRPFAWWHCESPEPRNDAEREVDQLHRLGLLQPGERERAEAGA